MKNQILNFLIYSVCLILFTALVSSVGTKWYLQSKIKHERIESQIACQQEKQAVIEKYKDAVDISINTCKEILQSKNRR